MNYYSLRGCMGRMHQPITLPFGISLDYKWRLLDKNDIHVLLHGRLYQSRRLSISAANIQLANLKKERHFTSHQSHQVTKETPLYGLYAIELLKKEAEWFIGVALNDIPLVFPEPL